MSDPAATEKVTPNFDFSGGEKIGDEIAAPAGEISERDSFASADDYAVAESPAENRALPADEWKMQKSRPSAARDEAWAKIVKKAQEHAADDEWKTTKNPPRDKFDDEWKTTKNPPPDNFNDEWKTTRGKTRADTDTEIDPRQKIADYLHAADKSASAPPDELTAENSAADELAFGDDDESALPDSDAFFANLDAAGEKTPPENLASDGEKFSEENTENFDLPTDADGETLPDSEAFFADLDAAAEKTPSENLAAGAENFPEENAEYFDLPPDADGETAPEIPGNFAAETARSQNAGERDLAAAFGNAVSGDDLSDKNYAGAASAENENFSPDAAQTPAEAAPPAKKFLPAPIAAIIDAIRKRTAGAVGKVKDFWQRLKDELAARYAILQQRRLELDDVLRKGDFEISEAPPEAASAAEWAAANPVENLAPVETGAEDKTILSAVADNLAATAAAAADTAAPSINAETGAIADDDLTNLFGEDSAAVGENAPETADKRHKIKALASGFFGAQWEKLDRKYHLRRNGWLIIDGISIFVIVASMAVICAYLLYYA